MLMSQEHNKTTNTGQRRGQYNERTQLVIIDSLKNRAAALKRELVALYLAARDPRTPWYTKFVVVCVVAYALSPIDLIPDPIPVLGYLDDLLLLPLGIYVALRLIPQEVLAECRAKARATSVKLPRNWWAGAVIVLLWLVTLMAAGYFLVQTFLGSEKSDARLGY
jgi:uncharacterized membrane protein YkvA (DUF1232 family)